MHFLRNALDYLPRKADDDCLQELRWLYDRRNLAEAQRDLAAWLTRWQKQVSEADRLGRGEHRRDPDLLPACRGSTTSHLKSTNMLERFNEELRRRTRVVRIFPNAASCLRLVRALCAETHEAWLEDNRYINMNLLYEERKEQLRRAA